MVSVRHKNDIPYSIITGVIAGAIAWRIALFLELPGYMGLSYAWLIVIIPIVWIAGINFGYALGRIFNFFNQFGRFAVIGFTNALVDFGYLNLLIAYTGLEQGIWFSVFKGASFVVANISSYIWNRYWTFEITDKSAHTNEYVQYLMISVVALIVNVIAASIVVNIMGPSFNLSLLIWANIGAITGSAAALIVNFVGYKLVVFKK